MCVYVCYLHVKMFVANRGLYVSELMIVSPPHPAYLSSLRGFMKNCQMLRNEAAELTCVKFDGHTKRGEDERVARGGGGLSTHPAHFVHLNFGSLWLSDKIVQLHFGPARLPSCRTSLATFVRL